VGNVDSAVDRRVIRTSVCFSVEVSYSSTVSNILGDVIHCIRLYAGGERSHLSLLTLVPDDTLNETLRVGADGEEVDGSGGGLELHGVVSLSMSLV
jgi:hypothetical protein